MLRKFFLKRRITSLSRSLIRSIDKTLSAMIIFRPVGRVNLCADVLKINGKICQAAANKFGISVVILKPALVFAVL